LLPAFEKNRYTFRVEFLGAIYMDREDLAKRIRDACLEAVLQAYEDAGVQGLCAEGRWEAAVGALRTLDLAPLLREFQRHSAD
jgi:hypothetical protein